MDNQDRADLALVAERLRKATEALSEQVAVIDKELQRLNLGVMGWVGSGQTNYVLGYARAGNKWGICIRSSMQENDWVLFDSAPRRARVEVMSQLPDLFAVLKQNAASMVEQMDNAVLKAKSVVEAIGEAIG